MSCEFQQLIDLLDTCKRIDPANPSAQNAADLLKMICQSEKITGIGTTMLKHITRGSINSISLLDVEQVAALLGKSTDWVKDEIKANRLVGGMVGREYRVSKAALERYLAMRGIS